MNGRIVITRGLEQAQRFAERFTGKTNDLLFEPLLSIEKLSNVLPEHQAGCVLILTSVNAVDVLKHTEWINNPVCCVGEATEQALRDAGVDQYHPCTFDRIDTFRGYKARI